MRIAFLEAAKVVDGIKIGATVSIGVTFTTNYKDEVDALLARADEALYEAKNAGRNRVMIRSEQNVQVPASSLVPDLPAALSEPVTTR